MPNHQPTAAAELPLAEIVKSELTAQTVPTRPTARRPANRPLYMALLAPLASLKFTVILLALGMILVVIGTLAQWRMDPNGALNQYFRTPIAVVKIGDLVPQSFFPYASRSVEAWEAKGGFKLYFPGGLTIGLLMLVNLLAAHGLKFKIQSRGPKLIAGCLVTLFGIVAATTIISTHQGGITADVSDEMQAVIWIGVAMALVAVWLGAGYSLMTLPREKKPQTILIAAGGLVAMGLFMYVIYQIMQGNLILDANNMRILWQLIQAQLIGLILLAGCYLLFAKRAGIVLLHAGVSLLLVNELLVYLTHVEWNMTIDEKKSNWVAHDLRYTEFTLTRKLSTPNTVTPTSVGTAAAANPEQLEVLRIPFTRLWDTWSDRSRGRISDPTLPVDVEAVRYYHNTKPMRDVRPNETLLATRGLGLETTFDEDRRSGANNAEKTDNAVLWVTLYPKGESTPLDTYMLSSQFGTMDVVDKLTSITESKEQRSEQVYELAFRYQRAYKPYRVLLEDVRKNDYLGSDTPRNYSSDIELTDPRDGTSFKRHIRMNAPLRYKGETMYQSQYNRGPEGEQTTLQIVKNIGWMIPYLSCMVVLTGLVFQFIASLFQFFNRQQRVVTVAQKNQPHRATSKDDDRLLQPFAATTSNDADPAETGSGLMGYGLAAVLLLAFFGYTAYRAMPKSVADNQPDLIKFGSLPAVFKGRVKPLDTLARNSLLIISRGETFVDNADPKAGEKVERFPAIQWLLELWGDPETFAKRQLIYIDHPDLVESLNLTPRKSHLYSWNELETKETIEELGRMVGVARNKDVTLYDAIDKKALELSVRMGVVDELLLCYQGRDISRLRDVKDIKQLQVMNYALMADLEKLNTSTPLLIPFDPEQELTPRVIELAKKLYQAGRNEYFNIQGRALDKLPPEKIWSHRVQPAGVVRFLDSYKIFLSQGEVTTQNQYLTDFDNLLELYGQKKFNEFNSKLNEYHTRLTAAYENLPESSAIKYSGDKIARESWFNMFNPFAIAMPFYIVAGILGLVSIVVAQRVLQPAVFWFLCGIFVLHTFALILRIYLSGRPPVTNLYSSAVFIGWGIVGLSLVIEAFTRRGFGLTAGGFAGFFTILISNGLYAETNQWATTGGDTMGVMQAVLDTNFWLATHVVTVSLGYSTTLLAGVFGAIYIMFGLCTNKLNDQVAKDLSKIIYSVICFGLVFSFVGTVLGGLWADDSWGRFWGWDPKENGALLIVLWNAIVLHARWDGMIRDRGVAVLSIFGAVVTSWSWFGVNELGVGLHSYGFTEGTLLKLVLFGAGSLLVMGLGCLPKRFWLSQVA